jgi:hypothetical protein
LKEYHEGQMKALKDHQAPPQFINSAGLTKEGIEGSLLAVLVPAKEAPSHLTIPSQGNKQPVNPKLQAIADIAIWKALTEDTRINDTIRRLQIHEILAATGPVQPKVVTKRLYKEILHADLDDPYLGLGQTLFVGYPFSREDQVH